MPTRALQAVGSQQARLLDVQAGIATTYERLGRKEQALDVRRDAYSGFLRLYGEEDEATLREANNYASSLSDLERFQEARSLMRRLMPVTRRVLGKCHDHTLMMRWNYARALCGGTGRVIAATGQLTGAHNLDAVKAALKTTR